MGQYFQRFSTVFLIFFSTAMLAEEVQIQSNPPQADVFVKDTRTRQNVKVGKTPLKMQMTQLASSVAGGDVFIIEIRKKGYDTYRVLLTRTGKEKVDLLANLEVNKNITLIKKTDQMLTDLFEVQRRIRVKDYRSAISKLNELEKDFPFYSIIYELKGSAFYLDQQFKKALSFYRKAFSVNPENRDAYRMKVYLEKKFNLVPTKS